jgi:hypothetical protein
MIEVSTWAISRVQVTVGVPSNGGVWKVSSSSATTTAAEFSGGCELITQHQNVVRLELDHLAVADIVHEFDIDGGAFHILHQCGRNERLGRTGWCLAGYCKGSGQNNRIEKVFRHATISHLPLPRAF